MHLYQQLGLAVPYIRESVSSRGFPSGIICEYWNDAERISMAPAQAITVTITITNYLSPVGALGAVVIVVVIVIVIVIVRVRVRVRVIVIIAVISRTRTTREV